MLFIGRNAEHPHLACVQRSEPPLWRFIWSADGDADLTSTFHVAQRLHVAAIASRGSSPKFNRVDSA